MALIDNLITISITVTSATPTRANFGTPLILTYHTHFAERVRTYFDPSDMLSDGFTAHEPAYLMATVIAQQNPRPPQFKVGRATTSFTYAFTFVVTDNTTGDSVGITLVDPATGNESTFYHTVSSETTTQVATALAALIDADAGLAATSSTATVTVTASSANKMWYPTQFKGGTFLAGGTDCNLDTDLDAILLVDSAWYGIAIEQLSATNIGDTASWTESNKKLFVYASADTANLTSGSGVMNTLKGLSYYRTCGFYSFRPGQFGPLGLMAQRFTADPGSDTWAYKTVVGWTPDDNTSTNIGLTPSNLTAIAANNGNYYVTIAGVPVTFDGRSAQGQFMDLQRGVDALANDMQIEVFNTLISNPKVPFSRKGVAMIGNDVATSLSRFTQTIADPFRLLTNDVGFAPIVSVPDIAAVSATDKKARILKNVKFVAYAANAIHKVQIQGTVSF